MTLLRRETRENMNNSSVDTDSALNAVYICHSALTCCLGKNYTLTLGIMIEHIDRCPLFLTYEGAGRD